MKWVLPLVLLVGCWNDEPGLHLEVRAGGTGAARIELYLATRPCTGCMNQLKPKDARNKLPGDAWLLDGDTMDRTPNTVYDVKSGKVVFDLLAPGAEDIDVEYVVAVGYGAEGKVVGVAKLKGVTIPHGRAKFWKITLDDAADQASSTALKPEGNRVWVWRRSDPTTSSLAACVGIEHSDGKTIERTWLVPEDDTDCDGIDLECDRYNYQAMGTTDLSNASCVTSHGMQAALPEATCLLGGQACIDGSTDMSCGPVLPYFCAPSVMCSSAPCRQDLIGCVTTGAVSYLKVTIPAGMNNDRCTNDPTQYAVTVDLSALVPTKPGVTPATCTDIQFAKLELNSVSLTPDFTPNGATFKVGLLTAPCKFLFSWTEGNLSNTSSYTFMDLVLSNGAHELLPLRVEAVPGTCALALEATFQLYNAPGDLLTSCAVVPKQP